MNSKNPGRPSVKSPKGLRNLFPTRTTLEMGPGLDGVTGAVVTAAAAAMEWSQSHEVPLAVAIVVEGWRRECGMGVDVV